MTVNITEEQKNITEAKPEQSSKDALQPKPEKPSDAKPQEPSQPAEATYTKEQLQGHTRDALMEQGRKHTATVKILQGKVDELSGVQDDREALKAQIAELSSKDPEVFNLAKKEQELRGRETELKKGIREHSERIGKADKFEREVIIQKVVEDYEGGDFTKLKGLCESFNVSSEDQIRTAADSLWSKPFVPPVPEPAVKPYSGVTSGGEETPSTAKGKMRSGWDERHKT